jgi:hypothetical protein
MLASIRSAAEKPSASTVLPDRAILGAIGVALDPALVTGTMEKALARLTQRGRARVERRAQVERELAQVQQRLDRLIGALAGGVSPADAIKTLLSTEKARKTALSADLARLERLAEGRELQHRPDRSAAARPGQRRGRRASQASVQAWQMLRKILADKIELEPVGSGRQPGL